MNNNNLLRCPNCNSSRFFIMKKDKKKNFHKLDITELRLTLVCVNCPFQQILITNTNEEVEDE